MDEPSENNDLNEILPPTISKSTEDHPFVFASLEKRTSDYLAQIRSEASRIATETKEEITRYRKEAERELSERENELNAEQERLRLKEEELQQREENLKNAAFEEERQRGFDQGKEEGEKEGYDRGLNQIRQEMELSLSEEKTKRLNDFLSPLQATMKQLIDQLSQSRRQLLERWESNLLQIATAIAHQAISRELNQHPELPLDLLRESLELAVGCASVKIRMNPEDLERLREKVNALLGEFGALTHIEILPDERISSGGSVVETAQGMIDQRIESRLERIISELSN